MNDINKIFITGRLTRDPEMKMVGSNPVTNFSIANGRTYVSNGEKKGETNFIDCEVWGKLAEIVNQYGSKGRQAVIEGRLKQSSWDTPEGKKASKIKVQVDSIIFTGSNSAPEEIQSGLPKTVDQIAPSGEDIF